MFVLVRALTQDSGAALVAGASFALMPARMEQFAKVQLHLLWWWPLALLALHRLLRAPTWRSAARLGAAIAAECYTCLYYGVFGGVIVAVAAAVLYLASFRRSQTGGPSRAR